VSDIGERAKTDALVVAGGRVASSKRGPSSCGASAPCRVSRSHRSMIRARDS